jgi:hypothetical protein
MNHLDAVKSHVVERYLLNELPPGECDAFEDHYFDCVECAADVRAGAVFFDNARATFREDSAPRPVAEPKRTRPGWLGWLQPAFLVSALACAMVLIAYQNVVLIPRLKYPAQSTSQAQVLQAFSLIQSNSRGPGAQGFHAMPGKPFSLFFDIPPVGAFSSYRCDVETATGVEKLSLDVTGQQAQETIQVLVPGSLLEAGDYILVVRGIESSATNAHEVIRYPFTLQYVR